MCQLDNFLMYKPDRFLKSVGFNFGMDRFYKIKNPTDYASCRVFTKNKIIN